tara:strand:+ start:448 stop:723 length:276 start_codon:yes stop_codon:yes gene_type:complete
MTRIQVAGQIINFFSNLVDNGGDVDIDRFKEEVVNSLGPIKHLEERDGLLERQIDSSYDALRIYETNKKDNVSDINQRLLDIYKDTQGRLR